MAPANATFPGHDGGITSSPFDESGKVPVWVGQHRSGRAVERIDGFHHSSERARVRADDLGRLPSQPHGAHLFDCKVAGPEGQCGTLRVPLDRAHPARAKLTLFFLYYRHRQPGPSREAIMLSEGGP